MNLTKTFFRLYILMTCSGLLIDSYNFWNRVPFEIIKPIGAVMVFGTLAIWGIVWCITPGKWWKEEL